MTPERAAKGGEVGRNGEFYSGGTFLPSTTLPKGSPQSGKSEGKCEIAPYVWAVPPQEGMRSQYSRFCAFVNLVTGEVNHEAARHYGRDADALKQDWERWQAGQRWYWPSEQIGHEEFAQRCQAATAILFSGEMVRALLEGRKAQTRRLVGCTQEEWVSPYGQAGADLWVRETWHGEARWDAWSPRDMEPGSCVWYAADGAVSRPDVAHQRQQGKARVSIHMPRWVCRTLLEIVNVRLERLHDISEADAQAEGITPEQAAECGGYVPAFRALWERVNKVSWEADNPWVWVIEFKVVTK